LELPTVFGGEQSREGCFASSGRTGKDHRRQPIGFQQATQQFAGAEKVLLTHEFIKTRGTHAGGERLRAPQIGGLGPGE
jgi:hypothetical protein